VSQQFQKTIYIRVPTGSLVRKRFVVSFHNQWDKKVG
jgi:hypothetical protein